MAYFKLFLLMAICFTGVLSRSWHWKKVYDEVKDSGKEETAIVSAPSTELSDAKQDAETCIDQLTKDEEIMNGDCHQINMNGGCKDDWWKKKCCKECKIKLHVCDTYSYVCDQSCWPVGDGYTNHFCGCYLNWYKPKGSEWCELEHEGDTAVKLNKTQIASCVANTNSYRQKHEGTADLEWDPKLAEEATAWAKHLIDTNTFEHAKERNGAGENIWAGYMDRDPCAAANKGWYSEIKDWSFEKSSWNEGKGFHNIGHFTAMVWKGSKKFGIGIAIEENYDWPDESKAIVVARYYPSGNLMPIKHFKANVGQLV